MLAGPGRRPPARVGPACRPCDAGGAIPTIAARRGTTTLGCPSRRASGPAARGLRATPQRAMACSTHRCDAKAASANARRPTRMVASERSGDGSSRTLKAAPVAHVPPDRFGSAISAQAPAKTRETRSARQPTAPCLGSTRRGAGRGCTERTKDPPGPSRTRGCAEAWFMSITERVPRDPPVRCPERAGFIAGDRPGCVARARFGPVTDAPRSESITLAAPRDSVRHARLSNDVDPSQSPIPQKPAGSRIDRIGTPIMPPSDRPVKSPTCTIQCSLFDPG